MLLEQRNPCTNCKSSHGAQQGGTPYNSPKLHPGTCSSVGMRRGTDRRTQTQTAPTNIHFAWLCRMRNVHAITATVTTTAINTRMTVVCSFCLSWLADSLLRWLILPFICHQCFDAVGWVSGRASGPYKYEWCGLAWLSSGAKFK